MSDYKNLIKRLRVAVEVFEAKGCELQITHETCTEIADAMERLTKERDAAIAQICQRCDNCKYMDAKIGEPCINCSTYRDGSNFIKSKWEWRGVTE